MSDNLKLFGTHSEYQTYMNGGEVALPNVSHCEDNGDVHYNPKKFYIRAVFDPSIQDYSQPVGIVRICHYPKYNFSRIWVDDEEIDIDAMSKNDSIILSGLDSSHTITVTYEMKNEKALGKTFYDEYGYVDGYAPFDFCGKLIEVELPDTIKEFCAYSFAYTYYLSSFNWPKSLEVLADYSLYFTKLNLDGAQSVGLDIVLPPTIKKIGSNVFGSYIDGGSAFKSITLNDGLEEIGDFALAGSISSLYIPKTVKKIGKSPIRCIYGPGIEGELGVKSIVVDPDNQWYDSRENCNGIVEKANGKLVSITDIKNIPSGVKIIGGFCDYVNTFLGASYCTDFSIPEGVEEVEDDGIWTGFKGTLTIPSTLTKIGIRSGLISDYMQVNPNNPIYDSRDNCNAIVETATDTLVSFGRNATFIPNTIKSIGHNSHIVTLNITVPNSVVSIGSNVFVETSEYNGGRTTYFLQTVTFESTVPAEITSYTFGVASSRKTHNSLKIIVPQSALNAYKTAEGWSVYADMIHGDNE